MGQPPNLRELISSADGVTFWASHEKATRELGYAAARPRGGAPRDCSRPKASCPPAPPLHSFPPMRVIDVEHLGRPHVIGCWEVDGMLVDPGPESSLHTLLEKLGDQRPEAILLTHIHLDHAAATGAMVARWPDLPVYVHERGAPHMIDPSRLLACAERLYGDKLEYLWGKIQPVPEANVTTLAGGETVRGMRVAYTPGHASHHVSYLHEETGTAFVGDVAACRIPPTDLVIPPTPPPDIDVELWEESIDDRSRPGRRRSSPSPTSARSTTRPPTSPRPGAACARRPSWPAGWTRRPTRPTSSERIAAQLDPEIADEMFQAVPTAYQWSGLDRYWRKKAEREAA